LQVQKRKMRLVQRRWRRVAAIRRWTTRQKLVERRRRRQSRPHSTAGRASSHNRRSFQRPGPRALPLRRPLPRLVQCILPLLYGDLYLINDTQVISVFLGSACIERGCACDCCRQQHSQMHEGWATQTRKKQRLLEDRTRDPWLR
jgi:hypothetical protein